MGSTTLLAKKNRDGSFSVSVPAGELVSSSFVDYYDDVTGEGYQRNEKMRDSRAKQIELYIKRCIDSGVSPRLFEITTNARVAATDWTYEALDENGVLGFLTINPNEAKWLSVADGGTRLEGIKNALAHNIIDSDWTVDARVFLGLDFGEEIAQFLLINEKQKKVRTDLSYRIVQRSLDEGSLSEREQAVLATVVPDEDSWKYEATRMAGRVNSDDQSPWNGLIQMPNDNITRPVKLQAFLSGLQPFLKNDDLREILKQMESQGSLKVGSEKVQPVDFLQRVITNFWQAVKEGNPKAHAEPETTVLWGSIGSSAAHIALAPILVSILQSPDRNLTKPVFKTMLNSSTITDYDFWFTRKGKDGSTDDYPQVKGEATTYTGAAGYGRLAKELEKEWRSSLHADKQGNEAVA